MPQRASSSPHRAGLQTLHKRCTWTIADCMRGNARAPLCLQSTESRAVAGGDTRLTRPTVWGERRTFLPCPECRTNPHSRHEVRQGSATRWELEMPSNKTAHRFKGVEAWLPYLRKTRELWRAPACTVKCDVSRMVLHQTLLIVKAGCHTRRVAACVYTELATKCQ